MSEQHQLTKDVPACPTTDYETANRVEAFDPPHTISWKTGCEDDSGILHLGGCYWRYDLAPSRASGNAVSLTCDWSETSGFAWELIGFPPSPPEHLAHSLEHLAQLVIRS